MRVWSCSLWTGGSTGPVYDADKTVMAFAARLMDAVDLDSVRDDLTGVVNQALQPSHVSVWSRQRDQGAGAAHADRAGHTT
jgi:hypothetical protein